MKEELLHLMEEYNVGVDLGRILIIIGCVLIVIFLLSTILDVGMMKNKETKYLTNFQKQYFATHNIKETMVNTKSLYRDRSKEARALEAGLYYLDHSLLRDYKGALLYIERLFGSKKITELHGQCIKDAQSRKKLLLTKLEESGVSDEKE